MSTEDAAITNPEEEEEERKNFLTVIAAFRFYRACSFARIRKSEAYLNSLPPTHQLMLTKYREHLGRLRLCIDANYRVIKLMMKNVDKLFENARGIIAREELKFKNQEPPVEPFKNLKVHVTLKQFARDWSIEGEEERRQCYTPIVDEILHYFDPSKIKPQNVKVLVPGAGMGRMAYEIARLGYFCEGNEFSLFMLIASHFVLNKCKMENQHTIYPWIHQFVNNVHQSDQVTPITFPDISPVKEPTNGIFNMVAGDFLEVYNQPQWDCVATCFFIDCANNVVQFIERIYQILKPGGIWINLGPLLYHYSDIRDEFSIEPTYEDLVTVIKTMGFEFLRNETGIRTKYAQNPRSMQQSEYLSLFWVCKKPDDPIEDDGDRILNYVEHRH